MLDRLIHALVETENEAADDLHDLDETLSKGAVEAIVALARWVATETRKLQKSGFGIRDSGFGEPPGAATDLPFPETRDPTPETRSTDDLTQIYSELINNR